MRHQVDADGLDALLKPRDDVVLEQERVEADRDLRGHDLDVVRSGSVSFDIAHGPFVEYRRTLDISDIGDDGTRLVVETYDYALDIPYFGLLFHVPIRRALRTHRHRKSQPWWSPPARLDARSAAILGTLAAAAVLTGYLGTLFGQTLTFAAKEFEISRTTQGFASAAVRFAPLFAIGLVVLADIRGRRRIAVVSAFGGAMATMLGALAPNLVTFVVVQTAARTFSAALGTVILVYIVEEMPRGTRAFALSLIGMASALGAGMVLWFLPRSEEHTSELQSH